MLLLGIGFLSQTKAQGVCGGYQTNTGDSLDQANIPRFLKIYDNWGNEHTWNELYSKINENGAMQPLTGGLSETCVVGHFTLHFADVILGTQYGFDNQTNGQLYQNVICQVFTDLSALIQSNIPAGGCHIVVQSNSQVSMPGGALGSASPYYLAPQGATNLVLDNSVWQTLQSGQDIYATFPTGLVALPNFIPNSTILPHAEVNINFQTNWHTDFTNNSIAATAIDMYSVVLHEAVHALGFASLIDQNGNSKIGASLFTRFDTHLRFGSATGNNLITNNVGSWSYTGNTSNGITNLWLGCANANNVVFQGATTGVENIYNASVNTWNNGSNLSHYQCSELGGCPYSTVSGSDYAMAFCNNGGTDYTKRHPNLAEVKTLCDLGYSFNGSPAHYGVGTNTWTNQNYVLNCNHPCEVVGLSDGVINTPNNTATSAIFPLANDVNGIVASLTNLVVNTQGAGTVVQTGNSFVFTPNAAFSGLAVISYVPICSGYVGNTAFVFVNVGVPLLPPCNVQNCTDNLIVGGDFEIFNNNNDVRANLCYDQSGWGGTPFFLCTAWTPNNNSPDLVTGTVSVASNAICVLANGLVNFGAGNNAIFLGAGAFGTYTPSSPTANTNCPREGLAFSLCNPVVAGASVIVSFDATLANLCENNLKPGIQVEFMTDNPISNQVVYTNPGTVWPGDGFPNQVGTNPNALLITNTFQYSPFPPPTTSANWQTYSLTIQNTSTQIWNHILLSPFHTITPPPNAGNYFGIFIDNVSVVLADPLLLDAQTTISNPNPCIGSTTTLSYTVCNNGSQIQLNPITLTPTLPAGYTIASGGSFNGNATLTIPANTLAPNGGCQTYTLNVQVANNPALAGVAQDITMDIDGACMQNAANVTATISPISQPLSITKTVDNATPQIGNIVTYTISVCNSAPVDINNIVVTDILPNGLILDNPLDFTAAGNALTATVNLPAALPLGSQTCTTVSFTATVQSCEPVQNCANAQIGSSTCSNVQSCVTITPTVGSNLTTITGPVSSAALWGSATISNQNFYVSGVLTINSNMIFDNCTFYMASEAKIEVTAKSLTLQNNTHLLSCEGMWWGIEVMNGAAFRCLNSTLEDAQWAVWLNNGCYPTIQFSNFFQNCIGIYISNGPAPWEFNNNLNPIITDCVFDGITPLQSATTYAWQYPTPLQKAYAGIWANDVNLPLPRHQFRNLCNGIVGVRANLDVQKCSFQNIQAYSPYILNAGLATPVTGGYTVSNQNLNGTGIIELSGKGIFSLKQSGFGSTANSPFSFQNCRTAIASVRSHLSCTGNNISNSRTGVYVNLPTFAQISVVDNRITCINNGITVQVGDLAKSVVLELNNIRLAPTSMFNNATAIRINNFSKSPNASVAYNTVTMNNWAKHGIYVTNADLVAIRKNTVILGQLSLNGIFVESTDNGIVQCDSVRGTGSLAANGICSQNGIYLLSSMNNLVSCNKVHNTRNGFYMRGLCTMDNLFRGNRMYNHQTALRIGDGTLAAQIGTQTHRGNRWIPINGFSYTGANVGAICATPSLPSSSPFIVHTTLAQFLANSTTFPFNPPTNPVGWFQWQTGAFPFNACGNPNSPNPMGECIDITPIASELTNSDYEVAEGLETDIPFGEELRYQAEYELFHKLETNPQLVPVTGVIHDFYVAHLGGNLQTFSQTETDQVAMREENTLSQLDDLKTQIQTTLTEMAALDSTGANLTDSLDIVGWKAQKEVLQTTLASLQTQSQMLTESYHNTQSQQAADIADQNAYLLDNVLIETNEKVINEIFFTALSQDVVSFDETQLQQIAEIAFQCPLSGGEGVFKARALYELVFGDTIYDDSTMCALQGLNWRKGKTQTVVKETKCWITVQPNPADNEVTVTFKESLAVGTKIEFINSLGLVMAKFETEQEGDSFKFDTSHLSEGVYYIRTQIGSKIYATKFVVQH